MKNKLDYDRWFVLQKAEHIDGKAHSLYALLRLGLGGKEEVGNRKTVGKWIRDLYHDLMELDAKVNDLDVLPEVAEPADESEPHIEAIDARQKLLYDAWLAAYHADHTRRVNYYEVFDILRQMLNKITFNACKEKIGEETRVLISEYAAGALHLAENVCDYLDHMLRIAEPVTEPEPEEAEPAVEVNLDPRYETPGCFESDGVFGKHFTIRAPEKEGGA